MNYRATPHSTTGRSPAKLLFGRKMNIMLPQVQTSPASSRHLIDTDFMAKSKMKTYADRRTHAKSHAIKVGNTVLLKVKREGKLMLPYKQGRRKRGGRRGNCPPLPYNILKKRGKRGRLWSLKLVLQIYIFLKLCSTINLYNLDHH